ncbi:hypothetical protein B0T24DRAFT_610963 [Lasiosphaeria ovina]|uniref:Uncharacterized protein n=1 Tax=Lasiosphaeria ovina TaxID=92902 RepID=A0AAE0ND95_9PEZI|nr:hypothetical protein B0T24DRAFT_610963 [Lasiosphaeria ovina]
MAESRFLQPLDLPELDTGSGSGCRVFAALYSGSEFSPEKYTAHKGVETAATTTRSTTATTTTTRRPASHTSLEMSAITRPFSLFPSNLVAGVALKLPALLMVITTLLLALSALPTAAATPTNATTDLTPNAAALAGRDGTVSPDSGCGGSEGQWNCMTSSWQRCAAGRWSVVMQCADGTHCTPAGLTYDFRVVDSRPGAGGVMTSGGAPTVSLGGARGPANLLAVWAVVSGVLFGLFFL